jgi:hypothetical protein
MSILVLEEVNVGWICVIFDTYTLALQCMAHVNQSRHCASPKIKDDVRLPSDTVVLFHHIA